MGKKEYIKFIVNQKFSFYPWQLLKTKTFYYFVYFRRKFQENSLVILHDQNENPVTDSFLIIVDASLYLLFIFLNQEV